MQELVLSRRNLLTLLAKLDKVREGKVSKCTIIKYNIDGYEFGMPVRAAEDEVVYKDRMPGVMLEDTEETWQEMMRVRQQYLDYLDDHP